MKTIFHFTAIAVLSILSFSSCEKWGETGSWYRFTETQCSDPWIALEIEVGLSTTEAVELFLLDLDIEFLEIDRTPVDPLFISCRACNCLNGRWIRVLAKKGSETQLTELGFFEE